MFYASYDFALKDKLQFLDICETKPLFFMALPIICLSILYLAQAKCSVALKLSILQLFPVIPSINKCFKIKMLIFICSYVKIFNF